LIRVKIKNKYKGDIRILKCIIWMYCQLYTSVYRFGNITIKGNNKFYVKKGLRNIMKLMNDNGMLELYDRLYQYYGNEIIYWDSKSIQENNPSLMKCDVNWVYENDFYKGLRVYGIKMKHVLKELYINNISLNEKKVNGMNIISDKIIKKIKDIDVNEIKNKYNGNSDKIEIMIKFFYNMNENLKLLEIDNNECDKMDNNECDIRISKLIKEINEWES